MGGITSQVEELTERVGGITSQVEKLTEDLGYSNSLSGVTFGTSQGDILFKKALKKVWIQILDPTFNATTLKLEDLCNKTNEEYNPWISFKDQDGEYAFSWYLNESAPKTGLQDIVINGFGKYFTKVYLHLTIDWDELQEIKYTSGLTTLFNVAELNKIDYDTLTLQQQLKNVSKPWKDKTIVCFGDSLTEFRDPNTKMTYSDYIKQFTGANVINVGIGGSQFRQRTTPTVTPASSNEAYAAFDIINMVKSCCEQDFTKQIAANDYLISHDANNTNTSTISRLQNINWQNVDVVTFFAGTNDWINSNEWGESGSTDINTTLGAINEIIRLLLVKYPHIKIFWFTPIIRWIGERIPSNFSDSYKSGTKTLKEFSKMIQDEVVLSHIPICDLYNTLGWNMYNFSNYFLDNDGTHPYFGFENIAKKIISFINANSNF